ncbi:MAG: hypothetical protein GKS03_12415 [Alphaproteobacteria bacterium]|nr:hypothetical protein [Alphaproteobacteria bacterium]
MANLDDILNDISSALKRGPLKDKLTGEMDLGTIGPFPLSRMTDLSDAGVEAGFDSGEIRIELSGIASKPLQIISVGRADIKAGTGTIALALGPIELGGQYRIFAIDQPNVDLDTGGNLMQTSGMPNLGDPDPLTVEQYNQLKQARDQRSKLEGTTNGAALVSSFNQHNEAYNQIFQTNSSLRANWQGDGATAEMATHTSSVISPSIAATPTEGSVAATDGIINSKTTTYGTKNYTYNHNAFQQQSLLYVALKGASTTDNDAAAKAVSVFADAITDDTDNTQTVTTEMTETSVYDVIDTAPLSKFAAAMGADPLPHHLAMVRIAKKEYSAEDLDILKGRGYDPTDQFIGKMQDVYAESVRQSKPENQADLWLGPISASLPASQYEFTFRDQGDGVVSTILDRNDLPVPDLQIDDTVWSGLAGDIARKRFSRVHFIRGLIAKRIAGCIERVVSEWVIAHGNRSSGG